VIGGFIKDSEARRNHPPKSRGGLGSDSVPAGLRSAWLFLANMTTNIALLMVTIHQSEFGWDQYVLNAEKLFCRSELARESHGER
jgi:hypothetical protein